MTSVDNRIVHMTFENKQFEQKLAETMASMDKLKASLDFSAAKKSFGDISTAASGFSLGGMSSAIENVSNKFLALSTVAITAIAHITSRAISAGFDMVKAFTFSPIREGFAEMETNMNSIQTILANTDSKGSTLEDVNSALNTLNEYSDQTIYNFSQMARNIGTFTAAGVDLDTSVGAIKGIANLAAISGSNADQASTAMYQLSQALASGSVKLMDWNSIVNAGMGGEVFQKALFETGKSLGTIADTPIGTSFDDWKEAGNSFRGSLEEGWLTAEVLTNTLQGFTGDLDKAQLTALGYTEEQADEMMRLGALGKAAATEVKTLTQLLGTVKESVGSGWSKSFQIIIGDFNEAKELFTGISEAIGGFVGKQADARNELLQGWKDLGGRTLLIEALKDAFEGIASIIKPIKEAFREIFPPMTADRLFELTERFSELTKKLVISGETADKIKEIFKGVFSGIKIVITIVKEIIGVFKDLFVGLTAGTGGGVLDFFVGLSGKIQDLKKVLVDEGGIKKFFDNLVNFFKDPLPTIQGFIDDIKGFFKQILDILLFRDFTGAGPFEEDSPIVAGLFKFRDFVSDVVKTIGDKLNEFVGWLGGIFNIDINIPPGIIEFFQSFGDNVGDNTSNSLDFAGGLDRISTALGFVWDALQKVWDILKSVGDAIQWVWDKFKGFADMAGDVFSSIFDFAKNLGPNLQEAFMSEEFDRLLEVIQTIAIFLGGKGFASLAKNGLNINADLTGGSLTNLGQLFKDLQTTIPGVRRNIEQLTGVFSAMQTEIKADALLKIAAAIAIITASLLVLSFIDPEALAKALAAMAIGFGQLIGSMALLDKMGSGPKGAANLVALGGAMIAIATAALILSAAVRVLSGLDAEELATGLAGITGVMLIMAAAAKLMGGSSVMLIAAGVGMVAMATSMVIMAGAVKLFSLMNWEEIGKGLAVITALLGILAAAMNLMPASTILIGPGLVAVAIAMNILAGALMLFATMSWKEIGKGLAVLLASLLIISSALASMGPTVILVGPGLLAAAAGIAVLAGALKIMGSMSIKEIGKSLLVLFGSLLILSAALASMTTALPGAIALGVAAVSLMLLAKVLKEFAKIKLKELGMGLLGIVAILATLGIAAAALQPVLGAMLLLGIALTAIGIGFALFGLGASLVAEAFQIIAAAGTAGIDVLMYALDQLIIRLPEMAKTFATFLLDLAQYLLDALPALIASLSDIIVALVNLLIENVPKFVELGIELIQGLLKGIREIFPDLVQTGFDLLIALLSGIRDNIHEIVTMAVDIITEFISGITDNIEQIVAAGLAFLVAFLQGIADNIGDVIQAGVDIIVNLLEGVADAIGDIAEAVGDVIEAFIDAIVDLHTDLAEAGTDALIAFLEGITENTIEIADAVGEMVTNIIDALADEFVEVVDDVADILIDFFNDMADVIRENDDRMGDAMGNLGSAIIEGMIVGLRSASGRLFDELRQLAQDAVASIGKPWEWFSPSHTMVRLGNDIIEGMIIGLNENSRDLNNTIGGVSKDAVNSFQKAIGDAALTMQESNEFNPTITPVLDLTNVKATAGQLGGLLGDARFGAQVSIDQARLLSSETAQGGDIGVETKEPASKEVKFEQNIYSPEMLNTAAIYRQTRNQIELAKKELEII